MKYTQIPADVFQKIQKNAGMLVTTFDPSTGVYSGQLGATTGGISFTATPEYTDFGEDIDNCPKNTMELKIQSAVEVQLSGTFVSIDNALGKILVGAGDYATGDTTHIIPRKDLKVADFVEKIWWIGDYSDINETGTGTTAGLIAVCVHNALNTGGLSITTSDNEKGQFPFELTGHFSIEDPDEVPYEMYIVQGTST